MSKSISKVSVSSSAELKQSIATCLVSYFIRCGRIKSLCTSAE